MKEALSGLWAYICKIDIGTLLTLAAALFVGIQQNKINKELLALQEAVDIYINVHTSQDDGRQLLYIHNTSSLPITIESYDYHGNTRKITGLRLPPASQYPNACFYIELPMGDGTDYVSGKINFVDSLKRNWYVNYNAEKRTNEWIVSCEQPQKVKK